MATAQLKSDKQGYDLVIHGGHVIDPETSLDAVRDVGIRGNQITALSEQSLSGKHVIDPSSVVVRFIPHVVWVRATGHANTPGRWGPSRVEQKLTEDSIDSEALWVIPVQNYRESLTRHFNGHVLASHRLRSL